MSELLRRGFIAALAPQGVPNTDIVVTDIEGSRLCAIQVKTRRELGSDGGWHMQAKHESIRGDRLFYCFVNFGVSPTWFDMARLVGLKVRDIVAARKRVVYRRRDRPGRRRLACVSPTGAQRCISRCTYPRLEIFQGAQRCHRFGLSHCQDLLTASRARRPEKGGSLMTLGDIAIELAKKHSWY